MRNLSIRKMNGLLKGKKTAFTLVELIIVIAIIAILAAIAIPKFGEMRENANVKADIANAKNIQTAVAAAVSDGKVNLGATLDATALAAYINGPVPKPKASDQKDGTFAADVSATGEVSVTADGAQVLPTPATPYDK